MPYTPHETDIRLRLQTIIESYHTPFSGHTASELVSALANITDRLAKVQSPEVAEAAITDLTDVVIIVNLLATKGDWDDLAGLVYQRLRILEAQCEVLAARAQRERETKKRLADPPVPAESPNPPGPPATPEAAPGVEASGPAPQPRKRAKPAAKVTVAPPCPTPAGEGVSAAGD